MKVPFEKYENMSTQQQFQDSVGPYGKNGKAIAVNVPRGWRRVEGQRPGRHFYVHMDTGTISRIPKEIFDCKKESWIAADGQKLSEAELAMEPWQRMAQVAGSREAITTAKKEETQVVAKPDTQQVQAEEAPLAIEEKPAEVVPAVAAEPALPVGLMFPGQGSQYVKMLSGVKEMPAVKTMLEKAQGILGYDLLELCLKGPESKLEQTQFCQPAMFVGGLCAVEKLRAEKPDVVDRCQAVAGLSLGEYTALCVAGVFDFETGLKLVKLRGEVMQEAASVSDQSMLSVAGVDQDKLEELCKKACGPGDVCQVANFLFPNGFSCAGNKGAVEKLMVSVKATEGCLQAKLLKTSGGFHTALMKSAKEKLLVALKDIEKQMKPPRCDVYMNVTAQRITPATKPAEIIELLGEQLTSCVLWEPTMRAMIKDGVTEFYECGPMKQLKAMMKRIDADVFKNTFTIDV